MSINALQCALLVAVQGARQEVLAWCNAVQWRTACQARCTKMPPCSRDDLISAALAACHKLTRLTKQQPNQTLQF